MWTGISLIHKRHDLYKDLMQYDHCRCQNNKHQIWLFLQWMSQMIMPSEPAGKGVKVLQRNYFKICVLGKEDALQCFHILKEWLKPELIQHTNPCWYCSAASKDRHFLNSFFKDLCAGQGGCLTVLPHLRRMIKTWADSACKSLLVLFSCF